MTKENIKKLEDAALSIGVVMPRCSKCKHWEREHHIDLKMDYGKCSNIDITAEISAGWNGGVVDYYETDENFFCASFNEA